MYGNSEAKPRAVAFLVFALVLFGAGAAMQLFGVKTWPWWLYGMGGFVLSQSLLKWTDSAHRYCPKCLHTMSVWPWTKQTPEGAELKGPITGA
jgi:hypothetical protein